LTANKISPCLGTYLEGTGRDVEGRACRSIMESESRGRDEEERGGRIGAEMRSSFERTSTGKG